MLKASRSIQRAAKADAGRPLPRIPELAALYDGDFKLKFRQGQVTMVAGQSGSQKSGFMLWMTENWGFPALYFCADMEEHVAMSRLAALITGDATDTVLHNIRQVPGADLAYAAELEQSVIRFCYDPNPTLETLFEEIAAWVELHDEYPPVIIVDNLMDMVLEGESEHVAMKAMLLELKSLARETGAAIFVLHHMSESGGAREADPYNPAPRRQILGKGSMTPSTILSVALDRSEQVPIFKVSVVKQRTGGDDPTGKMFHRFKVDPARSRFFADRMG